MANDHKPLLFSELLFQIESAYNRFEKSVGLPWLNATENMLFIRNGYDNQAFGAILIHKCKEISHLYLVSIKVYDDVL